MRWPVVMLAGCSFHGAASSIDDATVGRDTESIDAIQLLDAVSVDAARSIDASISIDAGLPAGPAFVQSGSGVASPWSTKSKTTTVSMSVSAGDLIALYVTYNGTATLSAVTDSLGNTYTIVQTVNDATNQQKSSTAYAQNTVAGADTVTATLSISACCRLMIAHEVSGVALVSPLDGSSGQAQGALGTGANAATSGPMTTVGDGDYIFAGTSDTKAVGGLTIAAGTGSMIREDRSAASIGGNATASEDQIQVAAGSVSSTFTFSASGGQPITMQMAFKP